METTTRTEVNIEALMRSGSPITAVMIDQEQLSLITGLHGKSGKTVSLQRCILDDLVFDGLDLSGSDFYNCSFRRSRFSKVDFRQAELFGCDFTGARLSSCSFAQADMKFSRLLDESGHAPTPSGIVEHTLSVKLNSASIVDTDFSGASLHQAEFTGAEVEGSSFAGAILERSVFKGTSISRVNFAGAVITGADFTASAFDIPNPFEQASGKAIGIPSPPVVSEDLINTLAGHDVWIRTDGQKGRRADFSGSNLMGVSLRKANLSAALFDGCVLVGPDLTDALLLGASFKGANLRRAVLRGADLRGADFSRAVLGDVDHEGWITGEMPDIHLSTRFPDGSPLRSTTVDPSKVSADD